MSDPRVRSAARGLLDRRPGAFRASPLRGDTIKC
jgi:hypothetical protein